MSDLHCTAKQIATWSRKPSSGHGPLEVSLFGRKQWKYIPGLPYEMWLVVSIVDSTIKLSRRNCFFFVPRQSNCSPLIAETKKTFGISSCDTYYSFPPLPSCVNLPLSHYFFIVFPFHCPHYEQSCPLYALAIPKPDVCFLLLSRKQWISTTDLLPSTWSDNGRTSTPCTKHCVAYATRLHLPYHPQPFRQSFCFTIDVALWAWPLSTLFAMYNISNTPSPFFMHHFSRYPSSFIISL